MSLSETRRAQRIRELLCATMRHCNAGILSLTSAARCRWMNHRYSFTPATNGLDRAVGRSVLWDAMRALPSADARLGSSATSRVGDNEPYSGRHPADYNLDIMPSCWLRVGNRDSPGPCRHPVARPSGPTDCTGAGTPAGRRRLVSAGPPEWETDCEADQHSHLHRGGIPARGSRIPDLVHQPCLEHLEECAERCSDQLVSPDCSGRQIEVGTRSAATWRGPGGSQPNCARPSRP